MVRKLWMFGAGLVLALTFALTSLGQQSPYVRADSPLPTSHREVCAIVTSMPGAADTDELLSLLETSRQEVISDLQAMQGNMEQYDAEGYGWQNVIDGSSALEPKPDAWLIGALRMTCEPQPAATVTGTVTYAQRIALPPDATLVVTLEDVSRADAPSTVIAERHITTAGQQVPIPFKLVYDPADIETRNRYAVRAQVFYGNQLRWTSTTQYPVITQDRPSEVTIQLEPV